MPTILQMKEYDPKVDLYFWGREVTLLNRWRIRRGYPSSLEFEVAYVEKRWLFSDKVVYEWVSWEHLRESVDEWIYNRCDPGGY